jgi:hypothetical protein
MGIFDPDEVITEYSLKEAIRDGVLVEIFKKEWGKMSGGKPIVATANVFEFEGDGALMETWNRFIFWRKHIMPKLPEEKKLFSTDIGMSTVWVIDDRVCYTILYPEGD